MEEDSIGTNDMFLGCNVTLANLRIFSYQLAPIIRVRQQVLLLKRSVQTIDGLFVILEE